MSISYSNSPIKSTNVRLRALARAVRYVFIRWMWYWAPGATQWMILRLFFTPARYRIGEKEHQCHEQGRNFQIKVHENTIQAWKWGRGPGVLLVHGWNGRGIQFHGFIQPLVEAGYTAIAIDAPAHGDSSGRYTNYFEFTDTVRAFLDPDQGLDIRAVIGHSLGASAAVNALAKEGLAIPLVCVAPVLQLWELLSRTFDRTGVPEAVYTALIGHLEARYGYALEHDDPHVLLDDVQGRVLIAHDTRDRAVPFRASQEQERNHAHVSLHATAGLGHRRLLEDPNVIRAAVRHIESAAVPYMAYKTAS